MKRKAKKMILLFSLTCLLGITIALFCSNRHAAIDQWSCQLVPEKITHAELSKEYGVEQSGYTVPKQDYGELLEVLKTVTEKNSSRKEKARRLEDGYRLAFFYEEKLWLFKCCEDQIVSLMFADQETGAYYGCEGKQLYINSSELWAYIKNTIDENVGK